LFNVNDWLNILGAKAEWRRAIGQTLVTDILAPAFTESSYISFDWIIKGIVTL
jgi:hypothetical protein